MKTLWKYLRYEFSTVQTAALLVLISAMFLGLGAASVEQLSVDYSTRACAQNVNFTGTFQVSGIAPTNANTASAIVKRDSSGNFSAGTITANLTGNASGTAANVTGVVAVANGGTAGATATAACHNLGLHSGVSGAMTSGVVVVLDAGITANSKIVVSPKTPSGILPPAASYAVDSQTAGWGFEIVSTSNTDTMACNWISMEP